jgi:hypothetical protein
LVYSEKIFKKGLNVFMRSIAEGRCFGVLALAESGGFGFLGLKNQGFESVGRVGAITEGLLRRIAAGTPSVGFSGLQLHGGGLFGGDIRFGHDSS